MKDKHGTEYALCPMVATDIDTFKQRFSQLIPMDCGRPWDEEAYAFWGWDELRQQLQSPAAYEPSDEDVERSALAMLIEQFGQGALLLFNPPREMTEEERQISRDRIDLARRLARTSISAFIRRE